MTTGTSHRRILIACGCDLYEYEDRITVLLCPHHRYQPSLAGRIRDLLSTPVRLS